MSRLHVETARRIEPFTCYDRYVFGGPLMVSESLRPATLPTLVKGVTLHDLPEMHDPRGRLTFCEIGRHVPFEVRRYFLVFRVDGQAARGAHAHHTLHQFLTCVHGRCQIIADDGETRQEFVLDSPSLGLHLPPMVWATQYQYSPGAVLLVLASGAYDEADYIREYAEFLKLAKRP
jgi:UDP-2-acetamido-3-amino-2,3-dideoxy-glucuronate N-acetyltransferase